MPRPLDKAFWQYVQKEEECWRWTGPFSGGWPQLCYQGKVQRAARLSYAMHVKEPTAQVRVTCGNRYCVNPEHLAEGDASENELRARALKRFWASVDKTPTCWLWTGPTDGNKRRAFQYGRLLNGVEGQVPAHRFSFELHKGVLFEGEFVCHRCDVPLCVNPAHLFAGTHQDNMNDMVEKQRARQGSRHPKTILTEAQVRRIREVWSSGVVTQKELASMFQVGLSTVKHILAGRSWRHI